MMIKGKTTIMSLAIKIDYLNIILTDEKKIAIRNTIFNLSCIYELICPILAKNYIKLL